MIYRPLIAVLVLLIASSSVLSADKPKQDDPDVPDCMWQPFKIFTNGHVRAPTDTVKGERLYLRKTPSYDVVLPGTGPFDWINPACNLWPGMQLRIADWGSPNDRFAKVYYEGLVFWVSKTYRDGSPTVFLVGSPTAAERHERTAGRQ